MIVLAHGPDGATARAAVARLVAPIDPDGSNTSRIDGKSSPFSQIVAMAGTPAFFGLPRVLIVDDLMAKSVKGSRSGEPGDDTDDVDLLATPQVDLATLFGSVAPDNVLVLIDTGLSSIPASVRKLAPPGSTFISGEPPRGGELVNWVRHAASAAGSDIPVPLARALLEALYPGTWSTRPSNPRYDRPPDLEHLRNEVTKLATSAHPGAIASQHIAELVASATADRTFPFVEALVEGRVAPALAELQHLQDAGIDSHRVTAQVLQHLELAAVWASAGTRVDPTDVGKALGLPNPNRMIGIARTTPQGAANSLIDTGVKVDRSMKRGELRRPEDAILRLLAVFAGAARGQSVKRRGGT